MKNPDSTLARILVPYYGLIQILHLIAIGRATLVLQTMGEMAFPAPPPAGSLSEQVVVRFRHPAGRRLGAAAG